jgi:hypothetical protein
MLPEIPELLWELMQWCWKLAPAERPGTPVLAEILEEMESHHVRATARGAHS